LDYLDRVRYTVMKPALNDVALLLIGMLVAAMWMHGPIPQLARYHEFADQRLLFGVPHAADVLSNVGFACIGAYGLVRLWPMRRHPSLAGGWAGYALFLVALVLTGAGSAYYHWSPDDGRLVWDRLPIALACAGLLGGACGDNKPSFDAVAVTALLAAAAIASVAWWYLTASSGEGDLRPYLLLQALPLLLIPLWQASAGAPRADRVAFAMAILLYVAAKAAELSDHEVLAAVTWISGHTLKHVLATASAAVITSRLVQRAASEQALERPLQKRRAFVAS